jgi:hypothetical protein
VGTVRRNTVTAAVREQEAPVGSSIAITRAGDRPVVPVTAIKVRARPPPGVPIAGAPGSSAFSMMLEYGKITSPALYRSGQITVSALPSRRSSTLVSEMFWNCTMRMCDFAGAVCRATSVEADTAVCALI